MFNPFKKNENTTLSELINSAQSQLDAINIDEAGYNDALEKVERLYKLQAMQIGKKWPSADTLLLVGGNLLGIGLIIGYERAGIITTKALSFVLKNKI